MPAMERSRTSDTTSEHVLGLLTAAEPVGAAQAPSLVAPADDPADRTEFTLDADAWEEWEALNDRPARDLPGLRAFMRKPVPFVKE